MAPPNSQKRVKGVSIFRPFIYGTTARPFSETNPKPPDCPVDHTHSWVVWVKGVDDTDITYWLKKVQFKLHESIPNPLRTIENINPGEAFEVHETGWGEFEISIKLYYVPESSEKPQTLYHHLRLHPYGETDEEKEKMRRKGEIRSWVYEEQIFNEPYENFYDILTSPMDRSRGGGKGGLAKGTKMMRGGMVGSVGERTASIPYNTTDEQPFGQSVAKQEFTKLREATAKLEGVMKELQAEKEAIEAKIVATRASAA